MRKINKKNERGVALPIALFILLGMLVSSMLLIKASEVSITIAGNIGAKERVSHSNDLSLTKVEAWLTENKDTLNNDSAESAYFSSYPAANVDYTINDNWADAKKLDVDSNGNISEYLIYRMCTLGNVEYNGSLNGVQNVCAIANDITGTGSESSKGYDSYNFSVASTGTNLYYKVLIKTTDPRGSSVITETVIKI